MTNMKLLYFVNSLTNSGGIERILVDKVNYLAGLPNVPYDIHVAYYGRKSDKLFYRLHPSVTLHPINIMDSTSSFSKKIMVISVLYRYIKQIVREVSPDVIINENMRLTSYILPFTFKNIPRIYVIHFSYDGLKIMDKEAFPNPLKRYFLMWLRTSLLKRYDKFIVLTEHDKQMWNAPSVEVIPNFTNVHSTDISRLSSKKAICVGRLEYQKDMSMLIRAWRLVVEKEMEWTLDIWGQGSEYSDLKDLIKELELEHNVFLRGVTDDVTKEYEKASLFVLASRYEGFALVLLEAMSMGLPCISFDISGCNNVIDDGTNGLLAKKRSEKVLAETILHYIDMDKEQKIAMQNHAIATEVRYHKDAVMKQWIKLFDSLTKQYRSKRL